MRIIKFRAKHTENGQWFYSDYLGMPLFWQQITQGWLDASTLAQYTGINDKNDVEIYEESIVDRGNESFGIILWMKMEGCFAICFGDGSKIMHDYFDEYNIDTVEGKAMGLDVIGDIHNNPELVGGQ